MANFVSMLGTVSPGKVFAGLVLCLVLWPAQGCRKSRPGGVPLSPVDISINVNNPAYADIAVPGGWLYLSGGSLGIVVYRQTQETFVAMDRHCPYRPEDVCRVHVDDSNVIARCDDCCGSAFLIVDGSVSQGPSALNLQLYNTSFNGTILRIYN